MASKRSSGSQGSQVSQGPDRWRGRVALVTGGSSGIGAEVGRRLAAQGARVGLVARSASALQEVAASTGAPDRVATAVADVTDRDALRAAIASVEERLGPVELLVNNAGIGYSAPVLETPPDDFRHLFEVDVMGVVHALQAVVPPMVERGRGVVVNVASVAGRIGAPREGAYSAAKFALVGLSECLAVELEGTGVSVHLVNPGPVETQFFSRRGVPYQRRSPRPVPVAKAADAVLEAAAGRRTEVYVPKWLGPAVAAKTLFPTLYRLGTSWDDRHQRGG